MSYFSKRRSETAAPTGSVRNRYKGLQPFDVVISHAAHRHRSKVQVFFYACYNTSLLDTSLQQTGNRMHPSNKDRLQQPPTQKTPSSLFSVAQVHDGGTGPGDASTRYSERPGVEDHQWASGLRRRHLRLHHPFDVRQPPALMRRGAAAQEPQEPVDSAGTMSQGKHFLFVFLYFSFFLILSSSLLEQTGQGLILRLAC